MAKIQDLIAKCDESEVFTQNLDANTTELEIKGEKGFITFLTDPEIIKNKILDKPESKIGVVIWFPKDVFER